MVKIKKVATARHEATLSPAVSEFVKATASIPLYQLPNHLASFPRRWPFPRGDLYHWISVLNRFDHILELLSNEYGLTKGPQIEPFQRRLLLKGDGEDPHTAESSPDNARLDGLGFSEDGDRELAEAVLSFTRTLLENCGNRNLYSSSSHLNSLLNTTSLSLVKAILRLGLRLAQRYYATRQRIHSPSTQSSILTSHYAITLDNVQKLASSFGKNSAGAPSSDTSSGKGKEKASDDADQESRSKWSPADLIDVIMKEVPEEHTGVRMSYYETGLKGADQAKPTQDTQNPPSTPTPTRRTSNLSQQQIPRQRALPWEESPSSAASPNSPRPDPHQPSGLKLLEISAAKIANTPIHELLKELIKDLPEEYHYELLTKVRVGLALSSGTTAREDIVAIRLLAVSNLAYIYAEPTFRSKISLPDFDEPRRLQLPYQLAELIHPPRNNGSQVPRELQTLALTTLDALTKHKLESSDVIVALSVNVNHGVLFYVVRKAVAELSVEDDVEEPLEEDEYREALFALLSSLPGCQARTGETLVAAGLLVILVEVLALRTKKAEWNYPKVLGFLDSFLFNIRDAFQSLVNAKGLDHIADLTSFEVESAQNNVGAGTVMPVEYKTPLTDYEIPWHQQQNLRWLVKLTNRMLTHANANFERLLRNLIDSPQLLRALRTILENAKLYGSTIWSGSVGILTNFIHNEPTSYAVIAEAGLSIAFLESVTQKKLPPRIVSASTPSASNTGAGEAASNGDGGEVLTATPSRDAATMSTANILELISQTESTDLASGILPSTDSMAHIPPAFGAICLNESGMKLFKESNAMKSFFEIFESPVHVKAMEVEHEMASAVGVSFDELLRHHPQLKSDIVDSIAEMIGRVGKLCFARASKKGAGAKLWIEGENGQLYVAGGWTALHGEEGSLHKSYQLAANKKKDEDVAMTDVSEPETVTETTSSSASINDVLELEDGVSEPSSSQYIGAVCRFLTGFFSNSNSIMAFAESSGLELLLDFATMACLPYNASDDSWGSAVEELSRVLQPLIEQKPHLTLPLLLNRAQDAVDVLEPLLDYSGEEAFFSPYTSARTSDVDQISQSSGTRYVKALVSVHSLCSILTYAFHNQYFSQRSTHNIFSQVNLADLYARLINSLGRLHRVSVWEEVLLQKNMPRGWEKLTRVKGGPPTSEPPELDRLLDIQRSENSVSGDQDGTNGESAPPNSSEVNREVERPTSNSTNDTSTAQFKNTRTLRFLLCRVPTTLTPFLQSLGKLLLYRRSIDTYHKQCSYVVADQIAKAAVEQLLYAPPKASHSAKDRYPYWITKLTSISRIMIDDSMERGFTQTLTLILLCFKNQGGFHALEHILDSFYDEALAIVTTAPEEPRTREEQGLLDLSLGGIKIILIFYSQIINSKIVAEATQTTALNSRPERDREKPDFFLAAQFLVELRLTVLRPVARIWQSELLDKCTTSIVKSLIDTLKIVLEGDAENGALKRSDKTAKRGKVAIRTWKSRDDASFKRLKEENFDEELAREALYRCNDNYVSAREYCAAVTNHLRASRNPIPAYEVEADAENQRSPSSSGASSGASMPNDIGVIDTSNTNEPIPIQELDRSVVMEDLTAPTTSTTDEPASESQTAVSTTSKPSYFTKPANDDNSKTLTVEDLDEERSELRKALIDRSLEVLNVHENVTFDLSDLINAAVAKSTDPTALRGEIGSTLLQYLISLQVEDDIKPNAKKIAASAHLLGLTLQDKNFYDATLEELKDNFSTLVSFIKIYPNGEQDESSPWIGSVLLVLEMLLADGTQPPLIQWTPPSNIDLPADSPIASPVDPVVPMEDKLLLFKALTDVLPHVGKDESLALSISRVLVILTRDRNISRLLSEKRNIQRLFLMVKQLAGITNERLQSSFLLVLRHMVEDDETIRQIMRNEIQTLFETRDGRQKDTTAYTRQMYHLAIRAPELFVEVTNEKLMLQRWEPSQRPQTLVFKPTEKVASEAPQPSDTQTEAGESAKQPEETHDKVEKSKPPVVENPDGVVHYLLCELLAYKEVDDKSQPANPDQPLPGAAGTDDAPVPNDGDNSIPPSSDASEQKKDKRLFQADQHPIFLYRCFLLQCLTELLSSYNRAKIEFINFSRKADPHTTTPSKPRSGFLNYLLNGLVPISSLGTVDDTPSRKQVATSNWAMMVIVALCAKTEEHSSDNSELGNETDNDPELLYVRRFTLEHALKSFREATASTDPLDAKYARLMNIADLFNRMINGSKTPDPTNPTQVNTRQSASQKQLSKIMYEKNFIAALTSAIADIDLNYPNAERAVRYILKALRTLTSTGVYVSMLPESSSSSVEIEEDDIASSASSISDVEGREATPDLFRNSTLGMLDPSRQEESESESEEEDNDEDEEMEDGYYDDDMDFEEDNPHGNEDAVSDPEDDIDGMGHIEGLSGDVAHVELTLDGQETDSEDSDMDEDDDDDDEDDDDDDDMGEMGEIELMDGVEIVSGDVDSSVDTDDEDEWENEEHTGEDYPGQDEIEENEALAIPAPLDNLVRALENPVDQDLIDRIRDGGMIHQGEFLNEEMPEEEEEDEQEDYDEEDDEFLYGPGYEDDDDLEDMHWNFDEAAPPPHRGHHHHHHHHHGHGHPARLHPWMFGGGTDRGILAYRSHRPGAPQRGADDGANPLLQRSGRTAAGPPTGAVRHMAMNEFFQNFDPLQPGRFTPGDGPVSFINNLINAMGHGGPTVHTHNGNIHLSFGTRMDALPPLPSTIESAIRRGGRPNDPARPSRDTPTDAVAFTPNNTLARWADEARLLFGPSAMDKSTRVINSLLKLLVPPAIEAAKRKEKELIELQAKKAKEEQELREKEEKERVERELQEKKELEEQAAAEAEAQARQPAGEENAAEEPANESSTTQSMEGVETSEPAAPAEAAAETSEEASERVVTTIRGREVDITALGIDMEYLEALPDDLREEVLMQRVAEQRSEAVAAGEAPTDISPEFLEALPADIRDEILQQEAQDRRRREREEARRRAAANGGGAQPPPRAEEMDPASFLASLDPGLRQAVLMDQDEEMLAQLPLEIAAEARALGGDRRLHQFHEYPPRFGRRADRGEQANELSQKKPKPRPAAQLLDKAGIATLLRLMFIPHDKRYLNETLKNVCQNRQNRAEVISILLAILQDGSADVNAVERSFAQLTIRAKHSGSQRTPQPKRAPAAHTPPHSEMSPLMVVQQCLNTLAFLADKDTHIPFFFLSEHETGPTLKSRSSKKGKGKESRVHRFPLNAILGLLDRKIIIESSVVMEQLASLLSRITAPLQVVLKKDQETPTDEKKTTEPTEGETAGTSATVTSTTPGETTDSNMTTEPTPADAQVPEGATTAENTETIATEISPTVAEESTKPTSTSQDPSKKPKTLIPPEVPDYNLGLVVNILAARECSSKTFRDSLSVISYLSAIPGAKEVFGRELKSQAQSLAKDILSDLSDLLIQISKAETGTEVQGMALAKFSPASSDQTKLLRVITALDYLFDPKRTAAQSKASESTDEGLSAVQREDMLSTLYETSIFAALWGKLSDCLSSIRQRGNMFNVATILLPLIEVLMVVCKNTSTKEPQLSRSQLKDFALSSPPPESRIDNLFFSFTEEHRKVLNDLVRHNPKLMSGSFDLLVKNSKVLEFDNKRNYFTRRLHTRNEARQPHQPLQLSVRRDQVFLDSFKSLYFKSADEMKYGKLSIRFHGEEGVDAGGVTREWFQVLARQMFDANYALFVPVASDRTTFHPNRLSAVNQEHLMFFKFIGRIIGKALYEGRVLDCHFSRAVYKRILTRPVSIKDMESLDVEYYKSLLWMLENDITDVITETFSTETDDFGDTRIIDLIENGRNIPVTEDNKHEYVRLVVEYKLTGSVQEQLEHFLKGFHDIVPAELVSIFNEQELELLISGLPDIDVDDWKNHTEYHNYTAASPQIQWFWRAVRSFDKEERAKLLQFVTGTSKVPLNGFNELEGMNGFSKFNIHRDYGNKDRLPSSHTCFNQLDLPEYVSYEKLREQLYTAMTAGSEYFGFA